jgi:hypothetical protein
MAVQVYSAVAMLDQAVVAEAIMVEVAVVAIPVALVVEVAQDMLAEQASLME